MFNRNFEKTTQTANRRTFQEQEEVRSRAGKRNKPQRQERHTFQEETN